VVDIGLRADAQGTGGKEQRTGARQKLKDLRIAMFLIIEGSYPAIEKAARVGVTTKLTLRD
jgi:hypothetical protein